MYTVCGLAVVHGLLQVDKIYSDNRVCPLKKKRSIVLSPVSRNRISGVKSVTIINRDVEQELKLEVAWVSVEDCDC